MTDPIPLFEKIMLTIMIASLGYSLVGATWYMVEVWFLRVSLSVGLASGFALLVAALWRVL